MNFEEALASGHITDLKRIMISTPRQEGKSEWRRFIEAQIQEQATRLGLVQDALTGEWHSQEEIDQMVKTSVDYMREEQECRAFAAASANLMRDVHVGLTRKIDEDTLIETHWAVNDAALVPRADGTFVLHRVISLTFNGEPVVKNYRNSTYLVGDETWKWCGVFQRSRFTRRWKFSPLDYAEEEEKEPCQKK